MTQNPTDATVAALERDWPDWQIWVVPVYAGPDTWCARRWDESGRTLNAHSATELREYLDDQAAEREQETGR